MASTVPAKSQSLHNFALPRLKWNNNHPRGGHSPLHGAAAGGGGGDGGVEAEGLGKDKRNAKRRLENHDRKVEKSGKSRVLGLDHGVDVGSRDDKGNGKEPRSRILIKIPASMRNSGGNKAKEEEKEEKEENLVMMDEQKAWNLRPRRPGKKSLNGDDGGGGGGGGVQEKRKDQLVEGNLDNGNRGSRGEKEKKVKFSLSLTRQEIEEDVYSLTGLKPSRKPKKRAKAVQKNLDIVSPGLWLGSITPDSYKVSEHSMKG